MENTVDWCQAIQQKLIFNNSSLGVYINKGLFLTVTVSAKIKVPRQVSASLILKLDNIYFFSHFALPKAKKYKEELKIRKYLLWNQV